MERHNEGKANRWAHHASDSGVTSRNAHRILTLVFGIRLQIKAKNNASYSFVSPKAQDHLPVHVEVVIG